MTVLQQLLSIYETMPLLPSSASKSKEQDFIILISHSTRKAGGTERKAVGLISHNAI